MDFAITPMEPEDWPAVCEIYRQGIATGNATFETEPPDWQKWNDSHRPDCRLVARERKTLDCSDGELLGWAALRPVSSRRVYAGVAEVSVYVAETARARGIGRLLLQSLIEESERQGIWTLQSGIFPENPEHQSSSVSWLPRDWPAEPHRKDRRHLERRAVAGTAKCNGRVVARNAIGFGSVVLKLGLRRDPVDFFFHRVPVGEPPAFENRFAALDHFRMAAEIGNRVVRI